MVKIDGGEWQELTSDHQRELPHRRRDSPGDQIVGVIGVSNRRPLPWTRSGERYFKPALAKKQPRRGSQAVGAMA